MNKSITAAKSSWGSWLRTLFQRKPQPWRRLPAPRARLVLERLEDRLAPASVSQVGSVLTITLDQSGENLGIASAGSTYSVAADGGFFNDTPNFIINQTDPREGTITASGLTEIDINDADTMTSVTFFDSGANAYTTPIFVSLTTSPTGPITFVGATTFNGAGLLAATEDGSVIADAGALLTVTGGSLALQSTFGDVNFAGGTVHASGGTTRLEGNAITVTNPSNDFANEPVSITCFGNASLTASQGIVLDGFANGALTVVTLNGAITQDGAIDTFGSGTSSFSAGNGNIVLDNSSNSFHDTVVLSDNLANNVTLFNARSLTLGNITLGTGTLSITARGTISSSSNGIHTGGAVSFDVDAVAGDVIAFDPNNIAGTVTISQSNGGMVGNIALRNANANAALPVFIGGAAPNAGYTLYFDNNGIAIGGVTLTGILDLTAGGPIVQTFGLTAAGGHFAVLGNFGITLTNPSNHFSGDVSLNNPSGDAGAAVAFRNGSAISLGACNLGLGTFSVSADNGDITQDDAVPGIVQKHGAGTATFTATTGSNVLLDNLSNDFSGPVVINGASVTTVHLTNTDLLATLPSLPAAVGVLVINFTSAPIALPNLNVANVSITAQGIVQQPGTALNVGGLAAFNSGSFPLLLTSTGNQFNIIKRLTNSGPNDVVLNAADGITLDTWSLGSGKLTVTVNGPISELTSITQAAGAVGASFSAGANPITLDQSTNVFTGPVSFQNSGANAVTVRGSDGTSLVLGTSVVGGDFTARGGGLSSDALSQAIGTTLTVGGNASFNCFQMTLNNAGNTLTGSVDMNASSAGSETLRTSGALTLTSMDAGGPLKVIAGGPITQIGAIDARRGASFDAGANAITLTNPQNTFGEGGLVLVSTGTGDVAVDSRDDPSLVLGNLKLGSGALTITTKANISQMNGTSITQTGPGALTLAGGTSHDVMLGDLNHFLGTLTVNATNVDVTNAGNITFGNTSTMTGAVNLESGGTVTLPGALSVVSLDSIAQQTVVSANITTSTGLVQFLGDVLFTTAVTIASSDEVFFNGNVTAQAALTINTASARVIMLGGVWNQGNNDLNISAGSDGFTIGSPDLPATFEMGTAPFTMSGSRAGITVASGGTFAVVGAGAVATVNAGSSNINFTGGKLIVGVGATNGELVLDSTGNVNLSSATLSGTGLAGASASPVLAVTGGGQVIGTFTDTVDANNNPVPFLMGTDIVQATYTPTAVSVAKAGIVAPGGTVTGFESDSDKFTVSVTGGTAAGLVVIKDQLNGGIDVVVRNAAAATTLTITTTKNVGDGFTLVNGIAVDGPGAVTITAPLSNIVGDITVQALLSSLSIRNMTGGTLNAGGMSSQLTKITARVMDVDITLGSVLNTLSVAAYTIDGSLVPKITAARFGTITASGNALADIPGDFLADLTNTNGSGVALASATISHILEGDWNLAGSVGAVTAAETGIWHLGLTGLVTNVSSLSLGVSGASVFASGNVGTITATSWEGGTLRANSFGTITITGNAALNEHGDFFDVTLIATGNSGGLALGALSVAGDLGRLTGDCSLTFLNGNVGTISVGRTLTLSTITAAATAAGGGIMAITVGAWDSSNLSAKFVGSLKVIGNAAAFLPGDFTNSFQMAFGTTSSLTLTGNAGGATALALGTFSTTGNVTNSSFDFKNGNGSSFLVGRELENTPITLEGSTAGNLTTITAAEWNSSDLTARTVGTFKVTGALQTAASTGLSGDLFNSVIDAFVSNSTVAAIGTFFVAGDVSPYKGTKSSIFANNGITGFTVGHRVILTNITVDNHSAGNPSVGRIATLTAGQFSIVNLEADSVGTMSITGFTNLAADSGPTPGDISGPTMIVVNHGAPGIGSLTVAGSIHNTIDVPFGIGTLTVGDTVFDGAITVENPLNAAAGRIGSLTVGAMELSTLVANNLGTVKTVASSKPSDITGFPLDGHIEDSTIVVTGFTGPATAPVAISNLTVAGDFTGDTMIVPFGIPTFTVAGTVSASDIAAGFGSTKAAIGTLTVGAWSATSLVANSVATWSVVGNVNTGLVGNVEGSLITILGNTTLITGLGTIPNVGLGTFSATGTVENSDFDISNGNVTSFTVGRFFGSRLLVGFRIPKGIDVTVPPDATNWASTNRKIGLFKTTALFSPLDPADTASFADSVVVAANLGTVSIAGLTSTVPASSQTITFGVAFRQTGGTAGSLTIQGTTHAAPFQTGAFRYEGLAG
jgi:hypothetical protein